MYTWSLVVDYQTSSMKKAVKDDPFPWRVCCLCCTFAGCTCCCRVEYIVRKKMRHQGTITNFDKNDYRDSKQKNIQITDLRSLCSEVLYSSDSQRVSHRNVQFDSIERWLDEHTNNPELVAAGVNYTDEDKDMSLHYLVRVNPPEYLVSRLLQLAPNISAVQGNFGNLPLHIACEYDASPATVTLLLQSYPEALQVPNHRSRLPLHVALYRGSSPVVIEMLLEAYPEAAQVQDDDGRLPLTIVSSTRIFTRSLLTRLLQAYPSAAKLRDGNGYLPLHYACDWGGSLALIDMILLAYPEGIAVKDNWGRLPSAFLKSNFFKGLFHEQMYPLHKAISDGLSPFLGKLLLEAFRTLGDMQDGEGMTPLHHACARNTADSVEFILLLLPAFPKSTKILDNSGRPPLPSLFFIQYASLKGSNGMLPLHRLVACPKDDIHLYHLEFLIKAYPAGASTPDNYDMLPFHHACFNGTSSVETLLLLLQHYPECLLRRTI